jgi:uncharacterized membrane protein (DUF373 family)
MLAKAARITLELLEGMTAMVLAVLQILALLALIVEIPRLAHPPFLDTRELSHMLDQLLALFVLIELLMIAVAYLRGSGVVRKIFEVMLVVIARKLISAESISLLNAGALAILIVALGAAWYLISRGEAIRQVT